MSAHNSQPERALRAGRIAAAARRHVAPLGDIEVLFGHRIMSAMAATVFLVFP